MGEECTPTPEPIVIPLMNNPDQGALCLLEELACACVPIVVSEAGTIVAIPAELASAVDRGGLFSEPYACPLTGEGSWEEGGDGATCEVRFVKLRECFDSAATML